MALGSARNRYVYEDDATNNWVVRLASDDVTTGQSLQAFDPASPPAKFQGRINPRNCRTVYAQGTPSGGGKLVRRRLICGTPAATLYQTSLSKTVTISGVTMTTTGRRGEKITF